MEFISTKIPGVVLVMPEPVTDHRGHFARWYCDREFEAHGIPMPTVQTGVARNAKRGTLRGLHFAPEEHGEAKLVRCTAGSVFDVVADLRPESPNFGTWIGRDLNAVDQTALFIPPGCAHGYVTLEDAADVSYQFSRAYEPGIERGVRWNDPDLSVDWPLEPTVISERDAALPFLRADAEALTE